MYTVVTTTPAPNVRLVADTFADFPTALREALIDCERGCHASIYGTGAGIILALSPMPSQLAPVSPHN